MKFKYPLQDFSGDDIFNVAPFQKKGPFNASFTVFAAAVGWWHDDASTICLNYSVAGGSKG
jgi:hypothetical protein